MANNPTPSMEVEVESVEALASWKNYHAHPTFPHDYIECPLTMEQLGEKYSITNPTTFYLGQEDAMATFFTKPPLTKPLPTTPSKKKAKHSMKPIASPTLATRRKTLREFVGFAHKHLGYEPTMELVMHPQVVAKYFGFHVAKGTKEGTLKRIATHLHQATTFVASKHCPKKLKPMDQGHITSTLEWYTNLNGKLMSSISKAIKSKDERPTLWVVWEATLSKWATFLAKLKVSGRRGVGMM